MPRPYAPVITRPAERLLPPPVSEPIFGEPTALFAPPGTLFTPRLFTAPELFRSDSKGATSASFGPRRAKFGEPRVSGARRKIRHTIVVPPFGRRRPHLRTWATSLKAMLEWDESGRCPLSFDPGDEFDFTEEAHSRAWGEHNYDMCPDDLEFDDLPDDHQHPVYGYPAADEPPWAGWKDELSLYTGDGEGWQEFLLVWAAARAEILADPYDALHKVSGSAAMSVLGLAGYSFVPGSYSGEQMAAMITDRVEEDPSLHAAMPDGLLFLELELARYFPAKHTPLASVSAELALLYDRWTGGAELLCPNCTQFMTFHALTPQTVQYPNGGVDLLGTYEVSEDVEYHSFVDEPDPDAPAGMVGWREVPMLPGTQKCP